MHNHYRNGYSTARHGFTLVELLIVIIVIAILTAIAVVLYLGAQTQAQATALSSGLSKVDESMQLWQASLKSSQWPNNDLFSDPNADGNDPHITWMIANTDLGKYLSSVPSVPGVDDSQWLYDWDGNAYGINTCDQPNAGVNIFVNNVSQDIAQQVDDSLDDGNLNCGKVRLVPYHGQYQLDYKLSGDGSITYK